MRFIDYIQANTGLNLMTGTAYPSNADITTYLRDGIKDVIGQVLKFTPEAITLFGSESDNIDSNDDGFQINSGLVIEVLREDGDASDRWRPAREVDVSKQYLVTDTDSFFYASKYNPVYIRDANNVIKVFPVPSTATGDKFKVRYVNFDIYDNDGIELTYSTDLDKQGLPSFPKVFHPHLILYGSIRALNQYYHYSLRENEDIELAAGYLATLKEMDEKYTSMFVTKEVIAGQLAKKSDRQTRSAE